MLELLDYNFMQRALVAGALVGIVCSVMGVFVVLRGLAFIGAGLSHAAFAGVALGLLLGVEPVLSAFIFCSLVAVGVGHLSRIGHIKEDTSIGIFFAASMAFGILIVGLLKNKNIDLMSYLFGSILTISDYDLYLIIVLGVIVLFTLFLFYKEFVTVIFDEEHALLCRMPVKFLSYLLLILLASSVVVSINVVGVILVSALIVIPAATALQLARDFDRVMLISGVLGVGMTEFGLLSSYWLNTAPGPTIVLFATAIFVLVIAYKAWNRCCVRPSS